MQLPSPTIHRFQPLRSGLINLFKYQDQEFWYDHGRLLIRGNNGTGKSRVLALQLPFLLDGEISPRRVEPDGDPARQIAWHLLMDEHDQRTGYTWIEFGRIDENGTPQFVTLGCGMRAIRGGDNQPTRWFFITDRRIGPDFSLLHKNHPLTAESLAEIIGDDCLYKVARDYRAAIDRRLFGIGPDRYAALIELLIRLRAPQLSKKIEADKLYAALSDALPPLSSDIVEKVATAFKDLDELRDQHKKLNTLSNELSRFQSGYQTYLQAALLRRAATLRSCHSDYEHAQRNVAEIERNLQQAKLDETTARDAITPANEKYTIADAHFEALLKSPRAQDAQTLDYAKRTATNAESHSENAGIQATAAARRIEKLDTEIEEHDTRHAHHTQNLATAAREATRLATPAGFATNHARLIPDTTWPTEPAQISKLKLAHEKASAEHLRRLDQLDARRARLDAAQAALTIAQTEENRLAAAIETHGETITTHDTTARTAVRQLADNYTTWRNALRWLAPPPWSQLSPSIDDWLETADNTHRLLAKTIATAAQAEATAHARAENGLQNRQRTLADERELLTTELKLLSAGPPPPPPPPPTRDAASRASRANRSGAPLWQVCEFQPHLTLAQCAGLEAALEASGLLDAWIAPDGTLSGDLPCDTFFPTSPPATDALPTHRPTLIDWLRPDLPDTPASPSAALNAETLRAVLTRIAAGPDSGTAHWVALDGRWQLGPVYGRGQKPATVHLGATSREAARLNRIDKLNTQLQALDQRKHALDDEAAQLDARATEAATEHSAVPADDAIATALTLRTEAHRQLDAAKSGYTTAIRKTHRAREDLQQAEDTLNRAVRDLGYAGHLHRLSELRPAWAPYDKATLQVWTAAQAWANSSQEADRLAIRRRTTDEEVTQTAEAAISARTAFLRAAEELSVLTRTLGTSIQDYQNELEAARTARTKAQTALDIAKENHATAIQKRNGYETSLAPAREKITDAETRRTAATLDLRLPLLHGLYTEAHPGLHDIETDDWSPTRAYAIARRLPKDLPDTDLTDTAWNHRINNLNTQINDLRTHTGPLGCQVTSHLLADGLTRVTCHYQGNEHTPALCLAAVERERATRERLLSDGERDIIDRHLVTEVSLQLQALIENARQRTDDINSEMTRCATTLGVTLRLVWEPATEGLPAGLPQVRRLLIADQGAWTTDERATVGNFLHQLINEQRERDPAATATEQLLRALDYRRWHTYAADRHQNNRWERLTRKRYGTGSGGEKALMLTIPQMAAASSHYRSTARHAPRLILLDEAFAGMDKPTRARCMGLLEAFDLDLLMTSEREWGTHASVSGIAIYQLVADTEAIAATRFVWNGRKIVPTIVPDTPELREQQPPPPSSLLAPDFQ